MYALKALGVILTTFSIWSVGAQESVSEPLGVNLSGRAMLTFDDNYYVIQTDKYYYKITKINLDSVLAKKLESAALNAKYISVRVPTSQIELAWPLKFWKSENLRDSSYDKIASDLLKSQGPQNGNFKLDGRLMLSLNEPYYLVQVNDSIYQLKKSSLTMEQKNILSRSNVGEKVSLDIQKTMIDYSWNFKPKITREVAAIREPDSSVKNNTFMSLTGTVLYSASEPSVIVQSEDFLYQLKRRGISTQHPELLDVNGARIKLVVPVADIEFFWKNN